MTRPRISKLHWRLYIPLVTLLWLIIGITIVYFVSHEKQRQKSNLVVRLLNVNNTVIDAYERGEDLQETVDFIDLFLDNTTLSPLRVTVYDAAGNILADNPAATIQLYDTEGNPNEELIHHLSGNNNSMVRDMLYDHEVYMTCAKVSKDGKIYSLSALPYQGEVLAYLSYDPMIWIIVIALGVLTSVLAYFGVRAVCRNVYMLRDFTKAMASDELPGDINSMKFSNDELGEVSRNLLTVYKEKIYAEQDKIHHERQISMNISHELNTPIGLIKGYVDTLVDDPSMPEEMRIRFLGNIQQNTDRLASIVRDVGAVMRLEEKGTSLKCKPLDFNKLAQSIARYVDQEKVSGGMTFKYNVPEGCMVMGHESLLHNALCNLVNNAVKYSEGTEMSLDWVGTRNGMQTFTFSDNGKGVEEKYLSHLFDLFFRVDFGRTRKTGGTGLGLPLVRRIITAMGGEVTVDNAPTGGLIFTFTIPEATATEEE